MPDNDLRAISLSLEQSGRELDSLRREVRQYGFWLGLEAPVNVMTYGWNPLKILSKASKYVRALPVVAAKKVTTFVRTKVIAPVVKASAVVKNTARYYAKKGGNVVSGTINTLSKIKTRATTFVTQKLPAVYNKYIKAPLGAAKDKLKKIYDAGKAKAAAAAKALVDGLSKLKSDLNSRIKSTVNKYITTGQNLVNSGKRKIASATAKLNLAKQQITKIRAATIRRRKYGLAGEEVDEGAKICANIDSMVAAAKKYLQETRGELIAAKGDANGAVGATTDIERKAKAEVTVDASIAAKIGGFIAGAIVLVLRAATYPLRIMYKTAKALLGYIFPLEASAKQVDDELTAAITEIKAACAERAKTIQKQESNTNNIAGNTDLLQQQTDAGDPKAAETQAHLERLEAEKLQLEQERQAVDERAAYAAKRVEEAEESARQAGTTQEDINRKVSAIITPGVPPETWTPDSPEAKTQQKVYQDLAGDVGLGMAVGDQLSQANNAGDVNAVGAAVEAAEEADGEPSNLPLIGAAIAVIGGGLYLLTKKKGGSYARA